MLAAVVAAAGLGVTAWGTLVSARVAEDQLAQSKVQSEERTRRQASRITFWTEPYTETTVIVNRSLDPANAFLVTETVNGAEGRGYGFIINLGTLPPCSQFRIDSDKLAEALPEKGREGLLDLRQTQLHIIDTYGQSWTRQDDGTLGSGLGVGAEPALTDPGELRDWWKDALSKSDPPDECGSNS
ncbi:hypothetical protein ACFUG9_31230 [Streptomyces griseoincarnatus]